MGCVVPSNTTPAAAAALGFDFTDFAPFAGIDVNLCPGVSLYYRIDPPCGGFVALQARGFDNDADDVSLALHEDYDFQTLSAADIHVSNGTAEQQALPFEVLHRRVDGGTTHLVELTHESGSEVSVQVEARYMPASACQSAAWVCEATPSVKISEQRCQAEPKPTCSSPVIVPRTPPLVDDHGTLVPGWVVQTEPDEIAFPAAPTASELALISARCDLACQAEYAHDASVVAQCTSPSAFLPPRLRSLGDASAIEAIDAADANGGGIFPGQSLACDLRSSCCLEFDEDVCPAAPRRVTPGADAIGRAEEHRLQLGGASEVRIVTNAGQWTSPLLGTVGYSLCADGNAASPCPFWLGSLDLQATASPLVEVDCPDQTLRQISVDALSFSLGQPAMGIAEQGTSNRGFPPGALVLVAEITLDGVERRIRDVNQLPAILQADASGFAASGAQFTFDVPCGKGDRPVTVEIDLESTASPILDKPPAVTITSPDTVACGASISLTANAADGDGDLQPLRWYVDGYLLKAGMTQLPVTRPHELKAVGSDARGGTTTDVKLISCP